MNFASLIRDLKAYANANLNVILSGKHGVGKTHIIQEVFTEVFGPRGKNWRSYSASTMDPWVDFIGIPKNYTNKDGKEVFGIIPPEDFTGEENIQALFFDEINRADEKTLNALMELIQFKSINGRKFNNLRVIWAAENPADDPDSEYMVKELDPAQRDRFQIQIAIPLELNTPYLQSKYGADMTSVAAEWWKGVKGQVSPRKLDDLLSGFNKGFNLSHFVPASVNVRSLQSSLASIHEIASIRAVVNAGPDAIRGFFTLDKVKSISSIFKMYPDIVESVFEELDIEITKTMIPHLDNKLKAKVETYVKTGHNKKLKDALTKEQLKFLDSYSNWTFNYGDFAVDFNKSLVEFNKVFESGAPYTDFVNNIFREVDVSTVVTPYIRSFIKRTNTTEFKKFFATLSEMLMAPNSNYNAISLYSKLIQSSDIIGFADINKDVAKAVIAYNTGKAKRNVPDLSYLFN